MVDALYATVAQVQQVLAKDAARVESNAASVPEETISVGIEAAQSEIDAKLGVIYTVPFDPVPVLITKLTVDIAAYLTDLTYRESRDHNTALSPVYLRYQRAEALLEQLQDGTAVIPPVGDTPNEPTHGTSVAIEITRPPLFGPRDFDLHPRVQCPPYWSAEGWGIH